MVFTKNSKAIETLLPPSAGSEGFQWYLGFYINFGAATNAEYRDAILLLDDPGVFLHPKGHKDLLDLFEGYLKQNVTTIYTTHLPFLIPRDNLDRLRLVQKESQTQSRVIEKFYATADKDILYPLRAALGITLADSLFVGEKTIVAEGVSDRILIYGMLEEFRKRSLKPITDVEKIEILAGGGARGAKGYTILLQIENLPYVVVLDNDDEGRQSKADFVKDGIPDERIIILSKSSVKGRKDFDIEDMFPADIYAEAFYNVHGAKTRLDKLGIQQKISKSEMKFSNIGKDLLKSAKVSYDLDKQAIAYEILRIVLTKETLDDVIVENFTDLFDAINSKMEIYDIKHR
jgi:predicted ATP-dependent endonuclease of OLD family